MANRQCGTVRMLFFLSASFDGFIALKNSTKEYRSDLDKTSKQHFKDVISDQE